MLPLLAIHSRQLNIQDHYQILKYMDLSSVSANTVSFVNHTKGLMVHLAIVAPQNRSTNIYSKEEGSRTRFLSVAYAMVSWKHQSWVRVIILPSSLLARMHPALLKLSWLTRMMPSQLRKYSTIFSVQIGDNISVHRSSTPPPFLTGSAVFLCIAPVLIDHARHPIDNRLRGWLVILFASSP